MEPPKPQFTDALKAAHPGLTDKTLEKLEELNSLRFSIDPEKEPDRLREIDRQRMELIQTHIPKYKEIKQQMIQEP